MDRRQVDVVTVYSPHPEHEKWYDYISLLRMQRDSAAQWGHQHWIVTDADLDDEFMCIRELLPRSLMKAMIAGVIARLIRGGNRDIVFVDADCLITRDLRDAFAGTGYDMLLTQRANEISPINNGAMYVKCEGISAAWQFFRRALEICGDHWGADQEAISQAASPIPFINDVAQRHGCNIKFVDMKPYNVVPKEKVLRGRHHCDPFVIHFKGAAKDWMDTYAARYVTV